MPELCFLLAPRQNHFFVEIVTALRDELDQLGVPSSLSREGFPDPRADLVYVLVPPHEYVALAPREHQPEPRHLERSIFFCTEQPGTWFFDEDIRLGRGPVGAVVDVNNVAVREQRRLGVDAHYAPLGWTRTWSRVDFSESGPEGQPPRDIDVLHLGIHSWNRMEALSAGADWLQRWNSHLVLSDSHKANDRAQANFAIDDEKWSLLSRARVLLNIHVAFRQYLEWQRVVQAINNGALVVSEHSYGTKGLEPGTHFLSGRREVLGLLAQEMLEDEGARWAMARDAYRYLRDEQPLSRTAQLLADLAEDVARRPIGTPAPARAREPTPPPGPVLSDDELEEQEIERRRQGLVRSALKDVRLDLMGVKRELRRLQVQHERGGRVPVVERLAETPAYGLARPRVSILVTLFNYEEFIAEALESCALGRFRDFELIVVDDASGDRSVDVVRAWMRTHPDVATVLLRHPVNRGLGAARNTAIDLARGTFSFILDADNAIYPGCLDKLVGRLDADPGAAASHSMLEMFEKEDPVALRSVFPWQPERFVEENFIDAMALWRTTELRRLGGFTTDPRLHGWEDYDLWVRLAEDGGRAALVPEVLGRYRVTRHSMLSVTDISHRSAVSLLAERYPKTMGNARVPQ